MVDNRARISRLLSENGMLISAKAANKIDESDFSIERLTRDIKQQYSKNEITVEDVEQVIQKNTEQEQQNVSTIDPQEAFNKITHLVNDDSDVEQETKDRVDLLEERYPKLYQTLFNRDFESVKDRKFSMKNAYEIENDISDRSRSKGEFNQYQQLFSDRFESILSLIKERDPRAMRVGNINQQHQNENVLAVGLVWSKSETKNGYYFIELEDPNSCDTISVGWSEDDLPKDIYETVVQDEVIAVRGRVNENGDTIWGDDEYRDGIPPILFPDIPRHTQQSTTRKPSKVALISDVHIGSKEFQPEKWNQFVDWVRKNQHVNYVIIGGDLVEGIGVYPDQKEELDIVDIYDQYAIASKMLDKLPDDVEIIISSGNHDMVRLAEPQPKPNEKYTKYFSDNVTFVGNPVSITIEDITILVYHGMSINALEESIPGLDIDNPTEIMTHMLRKRHLAPEYGKNVRLASEEEDHLVVDDVPDVLHCGHVHKYGYDTYNGVHMVNTATWQGQTDFQKSKGIVPDVGYWSVIDLSDATIKTHNVD